jgi:Family of unknown function (DUF5677)
VRKLEKTVEAEVKKYPAQLLRKLLAKKLQLLGIENGNLVEAFAEHLLAGRTEVFKWDDGLDQPDSQISLDITKEDIDSLQKDFSEFLEVRLPKAVKNTVREAARVLLKGLDEHWPEIKLHDENEIHTFQRRLEFRWRACLDPLRMMLVASREIGEQFATSLAKSRATKGITKRQALSLLHMRACQTTTEVIALMDAGLPDGATARWRTLYEISVVMFVIEKYGDPVAERYMLHDIVAMREYMVNEWRFTGRTLEPKTLAGEQKELETQFQELLIELGAHFGNPYGWAVEVTNKKNPTFQDLEKTIDWNSLPPQYKWASYKVHAGAAGTLRTLGTIGNSHDVQAGSSNAGLEYPASHLAYSLLHVTAVLLADRRDLETQIQLMGLIMLRDRAVKNANLVARRLETEELGSHAPK